MGFLGGFAHGVKTLGGRALGAVQSLGSKLGAVAGKVGDIASRVQPALSTINPAFGQLAGNVAKGAYGVGSLALTAASGANALRNRLYPGQAPSVGPGVNSLD